MVCAHGDDRRLVHCGGTRPLAAIVRGDLMPEPHSPATTHSADAILRGLPDMVFILDRDFAFAYANDTCVKLLGWSLDEVGRDALEFVHPDDVAVVATSMVTIAGKEIGSPIEFRIADASLSWRWVELVGCDLLADDGVRGYLCVARDITQRRMWEVGRR